MSARRGFTLIEMIAAAAILGAVMAVAYQAVVAAAGQQRALVRRQTALREAANAVERLAALPWQGLTPQAAGALVLSPEARASLPDGEIHAEVTPDPDEPAARRIRVEVRWPDAAGRWEAPVRLAAWRFAPASGGKEKQP